jgi:cytochrome c peroxidase
LGWPPIPGCFVTQEGFSLLCRRTIFAGVVLIALPLAADDGKPAAVTPQEAVGWKLFFDPILSRPRNTSCATCHVPAKGYEQGMAKGKGAYGDVLPVNTPTVVNLQDASFFFWDGRAESLEDQAKVPIANPIEMDLSHEEAAGRVAAEPHYRKAFAALGVHEITIDQISRVLAAYERRLVTGETTFDRWLAGDRSALTEGQERGRMIFFTRGQCALCHLGRNFTDGDFHNVATGSASDLGRYNVTKDKEDKGRFKTPSLRNWKGREPFLHDGRFATLRDVIEHYNELPEETAGQPEVDPLGLSEQEIEDLLAFMETLNGPWPDLAPFEQAWRELVADH